MVHAQSTPVLDIRWDAVSQVSNTTPTLQVVVNPPLRRGSAIHDSAFRALHDLGAEYVRYVPWLPYPKLAVAELEPGVWDTSLIDPMTTDFFNATEGHTTILNFSTIPAWLFKTEKPVTYPTDPDEVTWAYTQGKDLRENGLQDLADYYARLVSWYTKGGFTGRDGKQRISNFHFKIPYWEIFNEPEIEHGMSPQDYTRRYDAVAAAIHAVSPETKFVGLALAYPSSHPEMFEYFLDHKNHRSGIPLDMISYHFYSSPAGSETPEHWQYTFFDQADGFLNTVRYVEQIRRRLSPETRTTLNEIGNILPGDPAGKETIPEVYWNASGALYAYVYLGAMRMGIDVVGESQLVGYPTQFPSVSMVDWKTGSPNARFWVLKLIHDHFAMGDKVVETRGATGDVLAQAFITRRGRALLVVNKRNAKNTVRLKVDWKDADVSVVDSSAPPHTIALAGSSIDLEPFAVAVVYAR
ncbi:MAG: glycosyl hydrolase family 39 [Candidatus Sulfopaludibacter sp.]|nr:glycosyl hydrolase family 39 [Candidatus Sulfopaludibacter sp.]